MLADILLLLLETPVSRACILHHPEYRLEPIVCPIDPRFASIRANDFLPSRPDSIGRKSSSRNEETKWNYATLASEVYAKVFSYSNLWLPNR